MNENYIMLNGKRVDLTDEQIEKLGLKVEKKDYFKREINQKYYYIAAKGDVEPSKDDNLQVDNKCYNTANYCTDKTLLQQRAYHETLSRLLWRFSMQNDGDKIDWSNSNQTKYVISRNCVTNNFEIESFYNWKINGLTYFHSYTIAQRALDEIVLPFMKEHPDFVW